MTTEQHPATGAAAGEGMPFPRRDHCPPLLAVQVVPPRPHQTRAAGAPPGPLPRGRQPRQLRGKDTTSQQLETTEDKDEPRKNSYTKFLTEPV
jgi:hypothetical protein